MITRTRITVPGTAGTSLRARRAKQSQYGDCFVAPLLAMTSVLFFLPFGLLADEKPVRDVFQTKIQPQQTIISSQAPVIAADLQGISIGAKGSFAVINGEIFHEGEEKQGIKVAQIRKKEVDTIIAGVQRTLRMVPEQMSASPAAPSYEETGVPVNSEVETLQESTEDAV